MGLGKIARKSIDIIPYKTLVYFYPRLRKTGASDIVDSAFRRKFFRSSQLTGDKTEMLSGLSAANRYMSVCKGLWDNRVSNFCFVKDMLANIIWCAERGYLPVIEVYPPADTHYSARSNLWELFYQQPLSRPADGRAGKTAVCPIASSPIRPCFSDVRDPQKVAFWHDMLECFVKYNEKTQAYLDREYESLIKGKRVVACVLRSTDYTKLRPKAHPIQPSVDEVFEKLHEVMERLRIENIYLATEDRLIAEAFHGEFPGRVIENQRRYFNEQYQDNDLTVVSQVHFNRENDDYLKMLEYLSSVNLVSSCDCLVTGLNGGSEMAIYRNGNQYEYAYVFDKGVY